MLTVVVGALFAYAIWLTRKRIHRPACDCERPHRNDPENIHARVR